MLKIIVIMAYILSFTSGKSLKKHAVSILLLLALLFFSCKTTKTSAVITSRADTAIGLRYGATKEFFSAIHRYSKDTNITLPQRQISGLVAANGLDAARTEDGKSIVRRYQTSGSGLTAYVVRDTNGVISYGCDADSFTIVINRLIQDSIISSKQYDSLLLLHRLTRDDTATETKTTQSGLGFWVYMGGAAVVVIIMLAVLFIVHLNTKWL